MKNLWNWLRTRSMKSFLIAYAWGLVASYQADAHKSGALIALSGVCAALWAINWVAGA